MTAGDGLGDPPGGSSHPDSGSGDPRGGSSHPGNGPGDPQGRVLSPRQWARGPLRWVSSHPDGVSGDPQGRSSHPDGGSGNPQGGSSHLDGGSGDPRGGGLLTQTVSQGTPRGLLTPRRWVRGPTCAKALTPRGHHAPRAQGGLGSLTRSLVLLEEQGVRRATQSAR